MISVSRKPIKSLTFLFLVSILGMFTAGSISIRQAINNTDANLRRRMPTIVTVQPVFDFEEHQRIYDETGMWPELEQALPTPEFIREIAALPQVRFYDFAIDLGWWSVSSNDLQAWYDDNFPMFPWDWDYDEDTGTILRPRGVSSTDFVEMRKGIFDLVEGRGFTADELNKTHEVTPVLISLGLAEVNNLVVGSTFESRVVIWQNECDDNGCVENRAEPPAVDARFPLKVIGIFDPVLPEITDDMDMHEAFQLNRQIVDINRRIYLPNTVAEQMFDARIYGESLVASGDWTTDIYLHSFFVLGDPDDHADFVRAVADFEGDWVVSDLSAGFAEISSSMDSMREIADLILLGAVGAAVLVIGLLVLLFLRDRKHEIGVYLAIGDKKVNVVMQMVVELIPIAIVGLTISLLIGHIAAAQLSQQMLRQDLLTSQPSEIVQTTGTPLEELGYRFDISIEEMLDSYVISLDLVTISLFYGIGLSTLLISTLIPIGFAVNVDPKKLLMDNKT